MLRWLWTKKWNFRISSKPSNKNSQSLPYIWKPMVEWITKSKNMDPPSFDILILGFSHLLPCELMFVPQYKILNMKLSSCCKYITFTTKLFSSPTCQYFNLNFIICTLLFISKWYNNLFKTVIWSPFKNYAFMVAVVAKIPNMNGSYFEKLCMRAFGTFEKLFLSFWIFSHIQYSIQCCFMHFLWCSIFSFIDHFFNIWSIFPQKFIPEFIPKNFKARIPHSLKSKAVSKGDKGYNEEPVFKHSDKYVIDL